ncbi:MAG: hypothetical protein L3J04_09230 [Robiginitomaculum sp.]|nr:hypothetical protein [Robiginitomaculum sp.]
MVRVRGETSNRTSAQVAGASTAVAQTNMVRLDTDTSNQFWQELEEWQGQINDIQNPPPKLEP